MKILICTAFDINIPCAGLNRLTRMSKALRLLGIESLIAIGSGTYEMQGKPWKLKEQQGQKYVLYDKSLCAVIRHCNAMRIAGNAAMFYKNNLSEIGYRVKENFNWNSENNLNYLSIENIRKILNKMDNDPLQ